MEPNWKQNAPKLVPNIDSFFNDLLLFSKFFELKWEVGDHKSIKKRELKLKEHEKPRDSEGIQGNPKESDGIRGNPGESEGILWNLLARR